MLSEISGFQQWLRRRSPYASTYIHYTSDLNLFFTWCNKTPDQVTPKDIDLFIEHCSNSGHAVATINRRLAAIRTFYDFLDLTTVPMNNPVLPKRHYIRQGRRLPRDVEDGDLELLFAIINSTRDRAMFLLMLRCGLRVGEVRNLDLEDLYLFPSSGKLSRLWLRGKGGYQRVAYLSTQSLDGLQRWLEERPLVPEKAVFLNRFHRRITVTGIQYRLAGYCYQAGVWITCHQLRHTFARHLVEAGAPVTTIQQLLGHARLRSTETYLHIANSQVQADYQAAITQLSEKLNLEGGG